MNIQTTKLPCFTDERGSLIPIEWSTLPFIPARVFHVSGVVDGMYRGDHAHYTTSQYIIALRGILLVHYDSYGSAGIIELNTQIRGLYVPPGYWVRIIFYSDAHMLVFADKSYDVSDYITDFEVFRHWKMGGSL